MQGLAHAHLNSSSVRTSFVSEIGLEGAMKLALFLSYLYNYVYSPAAALEKNWYRFSDSCMGVWENKRFVGREAVNERLEQWGLFGPLQEGKNFTCTTYHYNKSWDSDLQITVHN